MDRRQLTIGAAAALAAPALAQAAPTLAARRRAALTPPARFLIVMLHGYDSTGGEILSLTRNLQSFAPTAALTAPNGPVRMGLAAFSWLPGRSRRPTPVEIAGAIDAFADAELAGLDLPPD